MRSMFIGLVVVRVALAQPLDQQMVNSPSFFIDNAVTKYELTFPGISNIDPDYTKQDFAYRVKFEKNINERIYFTGTVLKDFSFSATPGLFLLHTGIGYRFTISSAESINHHTSFNYISNFSVSYLFLTTQGKNRSLLLHAIDFSLDRYQWHISRYILLDIGLSLLPWSRITASNDAVSSVSNPFLYKLRYSMGLTFSENINLLFVHETFTSLSKSKGVHKFQTAFNGISLRVLL